VLEDGGRTWRITLREGLRFHDGTPVLARDCVASLRRWRPKSLRFETEQQRIGAWLADLRRLLPAEPELALELARAQRLVKGYGDTHARGWRHFEMIVQQLPAMAGQAGAAVRLQTLVSAALADDSGQALRSALKAH
jgi:indolepyruvate ferredoxin oxidoreductase beta subunit